MFSDLHPPPSIFQDKPAIVRVIITSEGRSFLTTLSPTAIPYDKVLRGMSRERYLEIDTRFAADLRLGPTHDVCVCVSVFTIHTFVCL